MTRSPSLTPKCLLGCSAEIEILRTLSAKDILTGWNSGSVTFSDEALGEFARTEKIHLYRCRECGFQFFDPKLAAGSSFYGELEAQYSDYYAPARPENERNARFAQRHGLRRILDVGCGTGFALDVAHARGLETYGIEFNPTAAAKAQSRGHTVFSVSIEEMDSKWRGYFDLISLNQVLEHVSDPVILIRNCISLLSPKGVIAIAVPSSEGALRLNPFLPASWPPHHISIWRQQDFATLSQRCGLEIIETGGNQLLGSELELNLLMNRELCLAMGKTYTGPGSRLIKLLALLYRKTGMKFLFRSQGHSIFCFARRKSST